MLGLLLCSTSCSEKKTQIIAESIDAEQKAPVAVKIARQKRDSITTAGCGCAGGGGGRGAIPLPSCQESHCSTSHFVYDTCDVVVRRDDKDASSQTPCLTDKPLELAVDPDGIRFATRDKAGGGWSYFAGGWIGGLFRWSDGGLGVGTKEKTSPPGPPDWSKAPSAVTILFQHAQADLGKLDREEYEILRNKILTNVAKAEPERLADNFAKLSPLDASSQSCDAKNTPWVKLALAAPPEQKAKLVEILAPVLERDSPSKEDRRDLFHYLALVDGPTLLRNVGDPARFLAKHAATAPEASAAVLDAWSRSPEGHVAAGALSCSKLLAWTDSSVVMAGLFAIARAKTKCPAVDKVRTLDCTVQHEPPFDLEAPIDRAVVEAKVKESDASTYTCNPIVGYIGALVAQPGPVPPIQAVRDRCWPPREATTDASDDAARDAPDADR